eukprot:5258464-Alexandrium_andersonii.AAC.1
MSASLVGSEMCIRDSLRGSPLIPTPVQEGEERDLGILVREPLQGFRRGSCLLYTSDAADDM